jgi:hypothetical protein
MAHRFSAPNIKHYKAENTRLYQIHEKKKKGNKIIKS